MAYSEEYAQALSEINELKAEIERLRAALREILDKWNREGFEANQLEMGTIAKEALEKHDE